MSELAGFPPVAALVPHAPPMLLIDRIAAASANSMTVKVQVTAASLFYRPGRGVPSHVGIEYIAQTIAAIAGYRQHLAQQKVEPRVGFLLGTRRMSVLEPWFVPGSQLDVAVEGIFEDGQMAVFDGTVHNEGRLVVSARVNVYQPDDLRDFSQKNEEIG
ncbi:ApeP family dehydratase [Radicibacter daui]|uniref:ApeP family dehydratase n=1 Tax=Radicibacter daui TaxID=3064829 RepID=UPI004046E393